MTSHEQLVVRGQEIVQNSPQAFIDIDVEADGVPGYGSLLSLGAVSPWGETFYAELKPTSEKYVPTQRKFCDDLGLTRERLMDEGEDPQGALHNFADWAVGLSTNHDKKRPVLAALPASFDCAWVKGSMFEAGIIEDYPFGVSGFCIKSLAMALPNKHGWDWRNTSKGRLPKAVIPPDEFTHNALEDAKYQQKIHFALASLITSPQKK
jgi:hypothetical protein